jgi:hypothetical protein
LELVFHRLDKSGLGYLVRESNVLRAGAELGALGVRYRRGAKEENVGGGGVSLEQDRAEFAAAPRNDRRAP